MRFNSQRSPHLVAMAAKLQTERGESAYRRHKRIAETPNGWIKDVLEFRQTSFGHPRHFRESSTTLLSSSQFLEHERCTALADHDGRRIRVRRHNGRHDGCIDHAQAGNAVHPEP